MAYSPTRMRNTQDTVDTRLMVNLLLRVQQWRQLLLINR